MYTHFYFVDIFPTEHVLFVKRVKTDWLQLPLAAFHINRHRVTSKIRLTMPRVKMSRADHNPWLAKMFYWWRKPEYQEIYIYFYKI